MKKQGSGFSLATMSLRLLCPIHFQAILLLFIALLHVKIPTIFAGSSTSTFSYFGGNETDHQALLAFKKQITHDPENILSSWNDSLHFCEWEGVTCGHKHKRVTVLDLSSRGLVGSLSPYIGNLSFIREIVLANNTIGGRIPDEVGRLFRLQTTPFRISGVNFGGLHSLEAILIDNNNLESGDDDEMNFFQSLVNCSSLQKISLSGNQFKGTLPNVLGNLSTQLTYFAIDNNLLFGEIPLEMGNLVNLTTLLMDGNKFSGKIPNDIGNLQKLQRLYLNNNRLSGRLPITLGNLTWLNELYLGSNKLQGTIPPSIENCQNLLLLDLSKNNLGGIIPKQIFAISTLSIGLYLGQNFFVGSLPFEVGNFVHLNELDLSENKLSSKIPSSLGSCTSLEYLRVEGNLFQGEIPTFLSSMSGIQVMDLSRNNFSSQIPNFLEKLSLKKLNLSFNDFQGQVPTKGVLANASAISLIGNSRLCGGISELKLPKCLTKEEKKMKWPFALKVVTSMACVILVITIVSFFLFYWRKNKRNDNSSESSLKQSFLRVSYQMLFKATDGFSLANLIGVGSFGSVYKGILGEDRSIVAIKLLNIERQGASRSFIFECEALKNVRHRNLVKIISSCSSVDFRGNDFKALVYEFMPNGSLENWLHMALETNITPIEIQNLNILQRTNIAIDVACALDYLHHHCPMPIVHCDLKPSNILLDCDMIAHVGDFGLAKFLLRLTNPKESSSTGIRGTIGYTPPEYGLGSEVSTKGDVYSYGILLLEMIIGKRPTNSVFEGGLNLHNYASMALPNGVMEVVDPKLLNNVDEVLGNHNGSLANKINECLISMVKVGVACSKELPQERWDISKAISELHLVRYIILGPKSLVLLQSVALDGKTFSGFIDKLAYGYSLNKKDKSKLEASGTAVEQWVKQAKSKDANEDWTLLAHSSFRDIGLSA
nr:receptor kinase-like protein Xa21 [Quercus suber]